MAEHFSIPSQEEAERFSEAYLAAQQDYYESLEEGGLTMSDFISRDAVLAEIDKRFDESPVEDTNAWMLGRRIVRQFPAADVVEVVRCKDCKSAQHDDLFGSLWCDGYHVDADFYCANGKRRADND